MESADLKHTQEKMILSVKIPKDIQDNPKAVLSYIKDADETSVKILLFLLCCGHTRKIDADYLSKCVSSRDKANRIDEKKITEALNFWENKKILKYSFNKCDELNKDSKIGEEINTNIYYEDKKISQIQQNKNEDSIKKQNQIQPIDLLSETLETKYEFRKLIHSAQSKFKCILNPMDLNTMFNLYEINKVDVNLLLKLMDACVLENKPNIGYLEKVALGMSSNGILTAEDYEKNYNEIVKVKLLEEKVLRIFKLGEHKFTTKEKLFIKKWAVEFDFDDEILEESYNICIERIKELKFEYINGILSNWNAKGFSTLEDIRTEFNKNSGFRTAEAKVSSFNIDQFFEKAVKSALRKI